MSTHISIEAYMSTQMSAHTSAHMSQEVQMKPNTCLGAQTSAHTTAHMGLGAQKCSLTGSYVCFFHAHRWYFQDRGKSCPRYTDGTGRTYNPCDWCNGDCRINWENKCEKAKRIGGTIKPIFSFFNRYFSFRNVSFGQTVWSQS